MVNFNVKFKVHCTHGIRFGGLEEYKERRWQVPQQSAELRLKARLDNYFIQNNKHTHNTCLLRYLQCGNSLVWAYWGIWRLFEQMMGELWVAMQEGDVTA